MNYRVVVKKPTGEAEQSDRRWLADAEVVMAIAKKQPEAAEIELYRGAVKLECHYRNPFTRSWVRAWW